MAISNVSSDLLMMRRECDAFYTSKYDFILFNSIIAKMNELCRLCLEESDMLYKLDSDFCILVMESGASVTIVDAMKYLAMDIRIPVEKPPQAETLPADEENDDDPESEEPKPVEDDDDPGLPKVSSKFE